jgi:mRNA interferase MazF
MDLYAKNFEGWITKKRVLHEKISASPMFKERDIWWVSVGVNVGFEEDGKQENFVRPVLVVRKFNREMFLGIPMSTKLKDNKYYIPVTVKAKFVSVMISQIRVFSAKRIFNKLAEMDDGDFVRVLEEVRGLFNLPFLPKQEGRG